MFDSPCRYDMILGNDFLTRAGIDLCFSSQTITWLDHTIPMKGLDFWNNPLHSMLAVMEEDNEMEANELNYAAALKEAKYDETSPDEVAKLQTHLTKEQQSQLATVLSKYSKLFSNKLDVYPYQKVHLELLPNSVPVHAKPYAVPKVNEELFKKELNHLCKIGVLEYAGASEWAAPTMGIAKKDGRIRIVSDFRALNKCIK